MLHPLLIIVSSYHPGNSFQTAYCVNGKKPFWCDHQYWPGWPNIGHPGSPKVKPWLFAQEHCANGYRHICKLGDGIDLPEMILNRCLILLALIATITLSSAADHFVGVNDAAISLRPEGLWHIEYANWTIDFKGSNSWHSNEILESDSVASNGTSFKLYEIRFFDDGNDTIYIIIKDYQEPPLEDCSAYAREEMMESLLGEHEPLNISSVNRVIDGKAATLTAVQNGSDRPEMYMGSYEIDNRSVAYIASYSPWSEADFGFNIATIMDTIHIYRGRQGPLYSSPVS
jgi:hypothetical protein